MGWFSKSREELERKQELERQLEEQDQRKHEQMANAKATVYDYADQLQFPTREIDVRFYNHLFSILLDQQKRIEKLENQLEQKKDV